MVTMPSDAAQNYDLVRGLVESGMDVMRINCAHDSPAEWEAMIANMRRANQESRKHCKVLMDLAGPKLRTGSVESGHHVVRWRVRKDARGSVVTPARIKLVSRYSRSESLPSPDVQLPVPETLVHVARLGDTVLIQDSRGKTRRLTVIDKSDQACLCTCDQSAYV